MPSAASFVECQKLGTRRSHSLPSAGPGGTRQSLALGKEWLCRVPQSVRHSAKGSTRQKPSLSSATLGKEWHLAKKMALDGRARPRRQIFFKKKNSLPSAGSGTRQRGPLPSAKALHSVKIPSLPSTRAGTRQNIFFLVFFDPFFCEAFPHYLNLHVQIWDNFDFFAIFC